MALIITTYTKMPQCVKCGDFHPSYKHVEHVSDHFPDGTTIITNDGGAEALMLTCRRCEFSWLMMCIPEEELS